MRAAGQWRDTRLCRGTAPPYLLDELDADGTAWHRPRLAVARRSPRTTRRLPPARRLPRGGRRLSGDDAHQRRARRTSTPWPARSRPAPGAVARAVHRRVTRCSRAGHRNLGVCSRIFRLYERNRDNVGQPGRPALPLHRLRGVEARRPAQPRAARVRHAARGGLLARQAAGDGLRDHHRPRHDRRGGRDRVALRRRVRLRGADRLVPRRAAGGPRPRLRHHARRPRVAPGAPRRRRGRGRGAARPRDRVRARPPLLRGRRAADAAPPPAARPALPGLGDAQRRAGAGAERARRRLHRDARRDGDRGQRRPRRRRRRPHVDRDAARRDVAGVPRPPPVGGGDGRGDQGSAAKWTHAAMAIAVRTLGHGPAGRREGVRPRRRPAHGREGDERGKLPRGRDRLRPEAGRRPQAAPRVARRPRPADERQRAARVDAVRRVLARRPLPRRAPAA